jgi:hypothetical protein
MTAPDTVVTPDGRLRGIGDHGDMSAVPDSLAVHPSGTETIDRAEVIALDRGGAVVGRATLWRLYGSRGELDLELAPTTAVALALVDAIENAASSRGLARLELDANGASERVIAALRRWRAVSDERRGLRLFLTWPTTPARS